MGQTEKATALYEMLERSLVEKKDEKRLIAARMRLADGYLAQKQWTKASGMLESLNRMLPDDAALAGKYARTLAEMRRNSEALRVYSTLASRRDGRGYWNERIDLLDAMLAEKKIDEVAKAADAALKGEEKPADDVAKKLEDLRRRCAQMTEEMRRQDVRKLIDDLAGGTAEAQAAARTALKARADEAWAHLVNSLDWADEKVRRAAFELLRELANQDFGYRPEATLDQNAEAIRKWKGWLKARAEKAP
jgi:hypothetical protein